MRGLRARVRSFWRGVRRPGRLEEEMEEEMRFHLEMEAERLSREQGFDPVEARRRAAIAFGGVESRKEEGRDARGVTWVSGLSLDLKLAWRVLLKSPGLTVIGGLGMAVAVAIGVGFFVVMNDFLYPELGLEEGERIVMLERRDLEEDAWMRRSLHDLAAWRTGMRSMEDLSAFRTVERALVSGDAPPAPIDVAQMTASSFRLTRVPPVLGRYLVEEDEREGAAPVAVLGYDLWQSRFEGDPGVIGREILLGDTVHVVVGVMPPGFAFPKDHELWTALRGDPASYAPAEGPEVFVFGRLAPGVTGQQAQAELEALGRRAAAESPATHARLRPLVYPYTHPLDDVQGASLGAVAGLQLLVTLVLVVVAANVAVLVYARTATRRGEIAVRSALGASRRRIVAQLFMEALLLAGGAALVGTTVAHLGLSWGRGLAEREAQVGYWFDFGLQPRTVLFAVALALLASVIVGVVPALQSTGRRLQADLRRLGGTAGRGMGRTWTVLIVVQVAVVVAALPVLLGTAWIDIRDAFTHPTFPAERVLAAGVAMGVELRPEMDGVEYRRLASARFSDRMTELTRRLESDPAVAGVTFWAELPDRGEWGQLEVQRDASAEERSKLHWVDPAGVDPRYFEVLGLPLLTGRALRAGDLPGAEHEVVVTRAFVREVLGGGNALGVRVRYPSDELGSTADDAATPWLEIVGVVEDPVSNALAPEAVPPLLYYSVAPGQVQGGTLAVRVRSGHADDFAPPFRAITGAVDPALRLGTVGSMDGQLRSPLFRAKAIMFILMVSSAILLSAAGIHALTSFTVTQRRREIGIRMALGERPWRLLGTIFARAAGQLSLGAVVGGALALVFLGNDHTTPLQTSLLLFVVATLMLGAGIAAILGPARRALAIHPMDALREE